VAITDVLAVVGAVTGISGALLGIASYRRDRSRVLVRVGITGETQVLIYVINAGRQPIAIVRTGLAAKSPPHRTLRRRLALGVRSARRYLAGERGFWYGAANTWPALERTDEPAVLTPGDLRKFLLVEDEGYAEPDPEAPIRGFAVDALGRWTWGPEDLRDFFRESPTAGWARAESSTE
jgi:hypothetical protein